MGSLGDVGWLGMGPSVGKLGDGPVVGTMGTGVGLGLTFPEDEVGPDPVPVVEPEPPVVASPCER